VILYGSTRSPFVRKVLIVAHELGLADAIALRPVIVSNTARDAEVGAVNPLGQIPAMVLDDGTALYDSLVICLYLAARAGENRLLPADGPAHWDVLTRHALGQGLAESLVKLFGERRRSDDPLGAAVAAALTEKIEHGFHAASAREWLAGRFDLGDIALAGAIAYADFRFPAIDWRAAGLGPFYTAALARPSMQATALAGTSPNPAP